MTKAVPEIIRQEMDIVVSCSLKEINDTHEGCIEESVLQDLRRQILENAKGQTIHRLDYT